VKRFALANARAYQHPRFVWITDRLPLASTNKIDRGALRRMTGERVNWVDGSGVAYSKEPQRRA
jgi:long-chain acyl-CoA synthetase